MTLAQSIIAQGILLAFFQAVSAEIESPFVDPDVVGLGLSEGYGTGVGKWVGSYKTSESGRRYESYEGIPYADPPIRELRFEPPQETTLSARTKPILLAKEPGPVCMQYDELQGRLRGREDCLYLNIYRPEMTGLEGILLPVIFYIHGDDFQTGSGVEYEPKYLLDHNVILVTFNYRLGPLGFLSTEDALVPGNMGLKDQVLALKWVKYNIYYFKGDPDNIALYGHGAGGASVHYHYLSPLTAGLFNKGMSMSGTALTPWAQTKGSLNKAKKLARILYCPDQSKVDMIKCLKNQPADYVVQYIGRFRTYLGSPFAPFGPVVEKGERNYWTFISRSPFDIINAGEAKNLPWITGFVGAEGLAVASRFIANNVLLKGVSNNWPDVAPLLLEYTETVPKSEHAKVAKLIRDEYLAEWPIASWTTHPTVQMIGDRLFVRDAVKAALLHTNTGKGPVRFYRFSWRGAHSFSEITTGTEAFFGVSHKDDLAYVFDLGVNMSSIPEDRIVREKMINLWVSYAADKSNSEPKIGINWPPMTINDSQVRFLHILRANEIRIHSWSNLGRVEFWDSLGIRENEFAE